MKLILRIILCSISLLFFLLEQCKANPDAKRLYDDLINGYNSMVRPVGNNSDRVVVKMKIKLSQLIDVNLKNQLMTTNVWLEQQWFDYKLKWDPEEYGDNFETHFCCLMLILKYQPIGGVSKLHVPSELIWLPDLVLYNNADGNYEITIMTKAILHSDGLVIWKPPAIYKSSCEIDVEYFPFDEQTCSMKFGTWSYSGYEIDLRHMSEKDGNPVVESGMDLSAFYLSVEWDIMAVPARRKEIFYTCCPQPYIDITFNITLRRKTLFYTVNLIIPCVAISFLSILVFYLPSDSGEKVSLSIMIMLSLVVFFLLLAEIIPPTSLTVPLLGKYLLFTMILITFSSVATIAILNVNFRSPSTHQMAPWVKRLFIEILPNFLCMERPRNDEDENERGYHEELYSCNFENQLIPRDNNRRLSIDSINSNEFSVAVHDHDAEIVPINAHYQIANEEFASETQDSPLEENLMQISPELKLLTTRIQFLSQHKKNLDKYGQVEENWKFVAMVLDRLFLWIFTISCISGAALIILRAPTLYNIKQPIDVLLSKLSY